MIMDVRFYLQDSLPRDDARPAAYEQLGQALMAEPLSKEPDQIDHRELLSANDARDVPRIAANER